jgi:glycine/D-amino acid oxidase-like deaminating enzyme
MAGLINRSIDLLEAYSRQSDDAFHLTRRGYLFVTADPSRLATMEAEAAEREQLGVDLYPDGPSLRRRFPYLTEAAVGGLHALRAGWFSAQQLGAWMLGTSGVTLIRAAVTGVEMTGERVRAVLLDQGEKVETPHFVNAAGPMLAEVGRLLAVDLPVQCEVHHKVGFRDSAGMVPRGAPMLIWSDPQVIDWSDQEQEELTALGRQDLLGPLPPGCHGRPEGGPDSSWLLALWEYQRVVHPPTWPLPEDSLYPEMVIKGMTTMVPGLARYAEHLPQPVVDGGYYTKTRENRPLIGPLPVEGGYVVGALSGFGVMAAAAAGELAALHLTGRRLPDYAPAFALSRYQDPAYLEGIDSLESGQI